MPPIKPLQSQSTNSHGSRARRTIVAVAIFALAFGSACRGRHSRATVQNEEPEGGPRIASTVKMGDAVAAAQLLRGFYSLEGGGSWRWTAGTFTVLLRPPLAGAQRGATLSFSFSLPDVVLQKLKTVTLSASVGGMKLKSETYAKAGPYVYTAEVPAALLTKEAVTVDFTLDKSLPAGSVDQRELGLVATSVGLEIK